MNDTKDQLFRSNAFCHHNFYELVHLERDKAVFKLDIRPESLNPAQIVHGGALLGMADNAAGYAVHSDGRHYVTQSNSMNFVRSQAKGTIYATGTILRRGRRTVLARVEITGDDDKLLAVGDFNYFCVDETV